MCLSIGGSRWGWTGMSLKLGHPLASLYSGSTFSHLLVKLPTFANDNTHGAFPGKDDSMFRWEIDYLITLSQMLVLFSRGYLWTDSVIYTVVTSSSFFCTTGAVVPITYQAIIGHIHKNVFIIKLTNDLINKLRGCWTSCQHFCFLKFCLSQFPTMYHLETKKRQLAQAVIIYVAPAGWSICTCHGFAFCTSFYFLLEFCSFYFLTYYRCPDIEVFLTFFV